MKYRQIGTAIWEDNYVLELNDKEFRTFIYLFTNHRVNLVGIYQLPDRIVCSTLGATLEELAEIKKKFEKDHKYFFYNGWVYINNFHKHNRYSSVPTVIDTYLNDFNSIPQDILKHFIVDLKLDYVPTIVKKDKFSKQNKVMVKVIVMDKYPSPYPRIEAISLDETVNPEDLPL